MDNVIHGHCRPCRFLSCYCWSCRLAGAQPSLANDLTELRAALQGAGVPIDQQQQQHSSTVSSLQQLRQQVAAPAAAEVRTRTAGVSSTLDYSRIAAELQERTARISSLAGKHDLIDAQRSARPSLTHAALPTGNSTHTMHDCCLAGLHHVVCCCTWALALTSNACCSCSCGAKEQ